MLNVIFKKSDLMQKKFVNQILSFNAIMKEIHKQEWYIVIIEYIQKKIESEENSKKHILDDKQNFRFDTKNSNELTWCRILSTNIKKIAYLKKLFRWNFLNKYHLNYEHLKILKLLNVINIKTDNIRKIKI